MVDTEAAPERRDFIRTIIAEDLAAGKNHGRIVTRFPPEPNGYLHIGHAKSVCLNFGIAAEREGARCTLRFDDTNPTKESTEYMESIVDDVRWLGFEWDEPIRYASDYFEQLFQWAIQLIEQGDAYVCSLSPEEIRVHRGTLREPGRESPFRNRPVAENLDLFHRMRAGEFPNGAHVLRARIDMASPNLNLRDPTLYRIIHASHYRTAEAWCIYPMYDYTHPLSDAIEGVTHSLCTLEFEDHRPLYDWVLQKLRIESPPRQIEFSRLALEYTVMSKRLLSALVSDGHVAGWDDPRMPTLSGLRRRGYTPASLRDFAERVGITKKDHMIQMGVLENCIRDDLDRHAPRAMCVLHPLKVVITNYPDDQVEQFDAPNHPADPSAGSRKLPFSKVVYIEREDFMEDPPRKYYRLAPGREVRLRYAYLVTCENVLKDPQSGEVVEVHCRYDPETRGGSTPDGRKVKGTIHWVSAEESVPLEVRLYDRLFQTPNPGGSGFESQLNPQSLETLTGCRGEPSLMNAAPERRYQFERLGYFCPDPKAGQSVFNRTVTLRDTWAKIERQQKANEGGT